MVRKKWVRKKVSEKENSEKDWCRKEWGENGVTQEEGSAIFCLDKRTAITCSKTLHLPGMQFLWLHTFTITISVMTALQVGKWHGRKALYCSRLPVHLRKKHHTDMDKVAFKVYNKHDYNLPLRCLPTLPPTWRTYVPFEMNFCW